MADAAISYSVDLSFLQSSRRGLNDIDSYLFELASRGGNPTELSELDFTRGEETSSIQLFLFFADQYIKVRKNHGVRSDDVEEAADRFSKNISTIKLSSVHLPHSVVKKTRDGRLTVGTGVLAGATLSEASFLGVNENWWRFFSKGLEAYLLGQVPSVAPNFEGGLYSTVIQSDGTVSLAGKEIADATSWGFSLSVLANYHFPLSQDGKSSIFLGAGLGFEVGHTSFELNRQGKSYYGDPCSPQVMGTVPELLLDPEKKKEFERTLDGVGDSFTCKLDQYAGINAMFTGMAQVGLQLNDAFRFKVMYRGGLVNGDEARFYPGFAHTILGGASFDFGEFGGF